MTSYLGFRRILSSGNLWVGIEGSSVLQPYLEMPSTSPKRPMYKGLPTFRAGGVASRTDYLRVEDDSGHKSALVPTYFSHNHFSSSLAAAKGGGSECECASSPACCGWLVGRVLVPFGTHMFCQQYGGVVENRSVSHAKELRWPCRLQFDHHRQSMTCKFKPGFIRYLFQVDP